ncbi:MAG: carboxypeptidase regulatory-like domain-containing protein, partial [candidate division Zixibacteria bacterium]|nr:carboxypeptidase regulatory-like domain-containing protein [candidate division Zixibacteria bacterium]
KGSQREGKIFGQVRDEDSKLPLPFATVIAYSESGFEQIALTDEEGKYVLEDLPITPFKVLADHSGYISEYFNDEILEENALEVIPTSSNVDFTLEQAQEGFLNLGGQISSEGYPISNASVYAFLESGEVVASAISDSEGKYVIENLMPGEYFLLTTSTNGNKQGPSVKLKFKDFCGADINIGRSGVKDDNNVTLPKNISLNQNYPNPFNPVTVISFSLKDNTAGLNNPVQTSLVIYDVLGRKVRTLLNAEMSPGDYELIWDGKNDKYGIVSSGIYFYRLVYGDYSETREMIRLK